MKCYIDNEECELAGDNECLAVFERQCRIHNTSDEELERKAKLQEVKANE